MGQYRAAYVTGLLASALAGAVQARAYDEYRNTAPGVPYVGSKVCSACHSRIYNEYAKTAMGQSLRRAADGRGLTPLIAPVTVQRGSHFFEVSRVGDDLYQSEYELGSSQEVIFRSRHKLEYAIGSGVNGITYLVRRGNYLFEAPLSFYARTQTWDLSPGYESGNYGFSRPVPVACLACHSGRPQAVAGREALYKDPPFAEMSIGCESCHGPGALHAQRRGGKNSKSGAADRTIVNPAALPARLADDICMNCHQAGDTRVLLPGRSYGDFRPGMPLTDTLAIFKVPFRNTKEGQQDLLEHHFSIKLSKCYSETGGRLNCLTCHDPHSIPARENVSAYYRRKCLTCHEAAACKLPQTQRMSKGISNNCVLCHMPKRNVGMIAHSALTNHRIVARPDEPLPPGAFAQTNPDLPDLIYLNRSGAKPLPQLTLMQAYGELMNQEPQYQDRYLEVLATLKDRGSDEPLVQAALGRKVLRESAPDSNGRAIEHLTKALKLGFTGSPAYEDLAEALASAGRTKEAIETLTRGIDLSPYAPRLHKALALRYINSRLYESARHTLQRYLELFPEDDFVRGLLQQVAAEKP
jgi:hypothetical protein